MNILVFQLAGQEGKMNGLERSVGRRIARGEIVIIIGLIIWYSPVSAGVRQEALGRRRGFLLSTLPHVG